MISTIMRAGVALRALRCADADVGDVRLEGGATRLVMAAGAVAQVSESAGESSDGSERESSDEQHASHGLVPLNL